MLLNQMIQLQVKNQMSSHAHEEITDCLYAPDCPCTDSNKHENPIKKVNEAAAERFVQVDKQHTFFFTRKDVTTKFNINRII